MLRRLPQEVAPLIPPSESHQQPQYIEFAAARLRPDRRRHRPNRERRRKVQICPSKARRSNHWRTLERSSAIPSLMLRAVGMCDLIHRCRSLSLRSELELGTTVTIRLSAEQIIDS